MSKLNEIKNKNVDFYVYGDSDSVKNSVIESADHGKINIVVDDSEETNNALYVGNSHIASGYGFEKLSDLKAIEEFLGSENIKKLVENDFQIVQNITYQITNEAGDPVTTESSYMYLHGDKIVISNDGLKGKSKIEIYDELSYIKLSDDENVEIKFGESCDKILNDDTISISEIMLFYDIVDSENPQKTLQYSIYANDELKYSGEIELTADGKQNSISIPIDDSFKTIDKNDSEIENVINYCIMFTDEDAEVRPVLYKMFTVVYRYRIFASISTDEPSSSCDFYKDKDNTIEITNTSTEPNYRYIWLPESIVTEQTYPIIFKKSNIAAEFQFEIVQTYDSIGYRLYKSPQRYDTNTSWIVK